MDYKDTLNLPQTDFPMKANLVKKEPELLAFWEKENIYVKLPKSGKIFCGRGQDRGQDLVASNEIRD